MSYLSRAQSFVERGEIMRAFYQLVDGLQRNPDDEQALDLLVDLYIGDFDSPGVERDLLVVLGVVPQGIDIYEMVYASLEQSGDERRLKSLVQTREREGLLQPAPEVDHVAPHEAAAPDLDAATSAPHAITGPRHTQFTGAQDLSQSHDGQWSVAPDLDQPPHHDDDNQALAYDLARPSPPRPQHDSAVHSAPTSILDAVTAPQPAVKTIDGRPVKITPNETAENDGSAMEGVFSSIDVYLDEEHKELRQELANRSKKRFLWVALGVVIIIALLIFASPAKETTATPSEAADAPRVQEESPNNAPKIEKPIDGGSP